MGPEPLIKKYEEYGQRLWWNKRLKRRMTTDEGEILEDIREACEFYLKYVNNPERLFKEHRGYKQYFRLYLLDIEKDFGWWREKYVISKDLDDKWLAMVVYNDWLFRLAFYDLGINNNERIKYAIKTKELFDYLNRG